MKVCHTFFHCFISNFSTRLCRIEWGKPPWALVFGYIYIYTVCDNSYLEIGQVQSKLPPDFQFKMAAVYR